jgi:hypothetical protein
MKKLIFACMILSLLGIVSTAQAGGPTPKNASIVAHCGCNSTGSDLEWVYVDVGGGKGHNSHRTGDTEVCLDASLVPNKVCDRAADDCVVAGDIPEAKGNQLALVLCGTPPVPETSCGTACEDFDD